MNRTPDYNEYSQTSPRLSGWLSVSEENENSRKVIGSDISWKLKSVRFCNKSKRLFITNIPGDDQTNGSDGILKSPGYDIASTSPKSSENEHFLSSRSNSTSRGRLEQQSSSFKQFFSRKLAISRTRSVGKIGTQKSEASSPKSPGASWGSWRSADSDSFIEEEDVCCMDLSNPDMFILRPIHASILYRPFSFQILTPTEKKYFSCDSEAEFNLWFSRLHHIVQSDRNQRVRLDTSLQIWIFEAKGIPARKKYFCELRLDKVCFARTSVKFKNDMLFWGEQFNFDDLPPTEAVTISLFREIDTKKKKKSEKSIFVGSAVVDLVNLDTNTEIEEWVSVYVPGISPKMQQKAPANKTDQAYLRTKLKYENTVVLPLNSYTRLLDYIKNNYLVLTNSLESSISLKTKDLLAQTLLKILHASDCAENFLVDVIMNEVENTTNENLTFRGNSLATKSIDMYMKMISRNYLQNTLGEFITSIYESDIDVEVDPQKLSSNACLVDNQKSLIKLVEEAWQAIFLSVRNFPRKLQNIFAMIRRQCEIRERDLVNKIVSASLFLRLLCPAILSPSLFHLIQEYPSESVARTLMLVAKTIQNIANFTRFGVKESYMEILNDFVEREMPNMNNFLQSISYEPSTKTEEEENCALCTNIDLARELSVLYHLLMNEALKLPAESKGKLEAIQPILDEITEKHKISPKADALRLSRSFATVASVCRKPLVHPSCDDSPSTPSTTSDVFTPTSVLIDDFDYEMNLKDCYRDTWLSFSEDYVSGCSLVHHRSALSRSRSNRATPRTEGRAEQGKKLARSTPEHLVYKKEFSKRSHSVGDAMSPNGTRVFETKGKFDKLLAVSTQAANNTRTAHTKHLKAEQPVLTSYKPRASISEQPIRRTSKEGSVKDRISLFSQKVPSSPNSRVPPSPSKLPVSTLKQTLSSPSKQPISSPTSSKVYFQAKPSTVASKPNVANKRPEGSIPVLRKDLEGKRNTPTSPLTRKPVIKVKPVVARKPSHDDRVTSKQDLPYDSRCVSESDIDDYSKGTVKNSPYNRKELELTQLKKEHSFPDSKSPDIIPYNRSPRHNAASFDSLSEVSSEEADHTEPMAALEDHQQNSQMNGKVRVSFESNRSRLPVNSSNDRNKIFYNGVNQPKGRDEVFYESSHQSNADQVRNNNVPKKNTEVARIYTNGFCEVLREGVVERSNSFLSSCSSTYSSDTYYSDDEDLMTNTIYIDGDNLSDVLTQPAENYPSRKESDSVRYMNLSNRGRHSNGSIDRTTSGQCLRKNTNCSRHNSVTSIHSTNERNRSQQNMDDVYGLQQRLNHTELTLQKTRNELKSRTSNFEQTVIHLKDKLLEADKKMKTQRVDTDNQMKNVITRLLNVESELRNEHIEMEAIIKGKEKIIDIQERRIQSLETTNARLVEALSNVRQKYISDANDVDNEQFQLELDEQMADTNSKERNF